MLTSLPLSLFAPLILMSACLLIATRPGRRPALARWLPETAALAALFVAIIGLMQLLSVGPVQLEFFQGPVALIFRLDALSVTMTLLVSFIGWVVMRYSRTYLDGEANEGAFHALMLGTLGTVLILMQSGSLALLVPAFILVGLGLRQLLLFYKERPAARRAATKFSWVWHAGDVALIVAAALLYIAYGTIDFAKLSIESQSGLTLIAPLCLGTNCTGSGP